MPQAPSVPRSRQTLEEHIGEINYFRVMSGKITENFDAVNTSNGTKERLSQIFACAGKNRTRIPEIHAGDIGETGFWQGF